MRLAHNLGTQRDVMDRKPGRVKDRDLSRAATRALAADEDLPKRGMDVARAELSPANRHIQLAPVNRLLAIVHDNGRLSKNLWIKLLLAWRIGSDRVDVHTRTQPRTFHQRAP